MAFAPAVSVYSEDASRCGRLREQSDGGRAPEAEFSRIPLQKRGRARWLLAGLVLLCLVPRTIAAWKIDTLCKDGVFYVHLANGYERGDIEAGLGRLRLNTYPLILAGLHRCGLDWELAARLWGVAVSSLVVLPLFGWLRRQFDDRAALCGCLLYAIHPKMIEWSPEAVRDPTFWLCWTCSLYATWRAVTEIRTGWFLAAGAAIALALNTRFEGWFLYVPLVWWSAWRFFALERGRGRLAFGATAAAAVCPLLLVAANLTFLSGLSHWEFGNFGRLQYVALWYDAAAKELDLGRADADGDDVLTTAEPIPIATALPVASHLPAASGPGGDIVASANGKRMSTAKTAVVFFNTLRRGIAGIFGLCWVVGYLSRPRFWLNRDQAAMFLTAACVAGGIWVHLWYAQATSSRYFLSIVILASGCSACGCLQAIAWLRAAAVRIGMSAPRQRLAWTIALLAVGALCVGEGLYTRYPGRQRDAAIGKWLKSRLGAERRLATSGPMELVDYYAAAEGRALSANAPAALAELGEWRPGAVVLSARALSSEEFNSIIAGARNLGFTRVASRQLPPGYDWKDLAVLEQRDIGGAAAAAQTCPELAASTN